MTWPLIAECALMAAAAGVGGWLAQRTRDRCRQGTLRDLETRVLALNRFLTDRAPCRLAPADGDALRLRLERLEHALHLTPVVHPPGCGDPDALGSQPAALDAAPSVVDEWTVPPPVEWTPGHRRLRAVEDAVRRLGAPLDREHVPPPARGTHARADDLTRIAGIGRSTARLLHGIGVHHVWQIAQWTPLDVAYADAQLKGLGGRIARDDWVAQARALARSPSEAAPTP